MGRLIKFSYVNALGDFPAVLAHYQIEYAHKGDTLRLRCPFHDDKTPSLSVTLEATGDALANTFHCFGCHKSGSIIDFVTALEGTGDLRAAAEFVATMSGCALAPPRAARGKAGKAGKGEKSPRTPRTGGKASKAPNAAEKFETAPPGASQGASGGIPPLKFALKLETEHPYLDERADPATIAAFGLGYLPSSSRSMMADRLCIPIHDAAGVLVAYAGRFASGDVPDDAEKYLFPPNFPKSAVLFNAHRVGETEDIVVVEGFFGAMRLHMLGAPVVALMGTAGSAAHVAALQALGVRRVLVLLDGDAPGQAALPALVSLLARSFFVTARLLPDGLGPDDLSDAELHEFAAVF